MKRHLSLILAALVASLTTHPLFAEDTATTASVGFPAQAIAAANTTVPVTGARIALGDTQKTVGKRLGIPMTCLSPDAWIYENVEITLPGESQPRTKNIYVVFTDGKVSTLAIVGDRKRDTLIAEARSKALGTVTMTGIE